MSWRAVFWVDGKLREVAAAPVDLTDRGLTLGDGLFETVLTRNGRSFLRSAHLSRLEESAEALGIFSEPANAADALDALAAAIGDGVVRLTLTRGGGARGLALPETPKPFLFGAAAPNSDAAFFPTLRLASTAIRRNETSPTSRLKTLAYLDPILALEDAKKAGADDVLFENTIGHVACLSVANLFAVFGQSLVTPPLSDGVLAGTVRALILKRASSAGFSPEERSLTRADLLRADSIFATNSIRLLAPCVALDGRALGAGESQPVKALQKILLQAVEEDCGA
ncbi:MAG TPA: aminotransferase class IV [Methylovirgula sp.]|jgi:branched-chain amino acid aminotransferase